VSKHRDELIGENISLTAEVERLRSLASLVVTDGEDGLLMKRLELVWNGLAQMPDKVESTLTDLGVGPIEVRRMAEDVKQTLAQARRVIEGDTS